jgi:hypothetical protein
VSTAAFGAGGDAAPFDVDDDVAGLWFGQQQLSQRQLFRVLENDGGGLRHDSNSDTPQGVSFRAGAGAWCTEVLELEMSSYAYEKKCQAMLTLG